MRFSRTSAVFKAGWRGCVSNGSHEVIAGSGCGLIGSAEENNVLGRLDFNVALNCKAWLFFRWGILFLNSLFNWCPGQDLNL